MLLTLVLEGAPGRTGGDTTNTALVLAGGFVGPLGRCQRDNSLRGIDRAATPEAPVRPPWSTSHGRTSGATAAARRRQMAGRAAGNPPSTNGVTHRHGLAAGLLPTAQRARCATLDVAAAEAGDDGE
jgi:hypothetical protein